MSKKYYHWFQEAHVLVEDTIDPQDIVETRVFSN